MGAARYKPYSRYTSSNVDWLGNIPESWKVIQVGRLFRRVKRTDHTEKQLLSVYRDHGVIPKASRDDNNNKASEDLSPYQLVEENDLVLNKMKTWQGSIAISEHEGIVSPAYFVYQPGPKLFDVAVPKYAHFLLRNPMYISQYLRRSKGIRVSQWDLDPGEFQKIELLLPTIPEQTKIAAFLDFETGKIDALIAKQERLIALLEEKRQAVISHAVTKGLNANAPLRPSGIDWLGDVPEHWGVKPLKYLCSFSGGGTPSKEVASFWRDGTVPWVSPKDMKTFYLDETQDKITPAAVETSSTNYVEPGALLMVVRSGILQRAIPIAVNRSQVTLNQDMKAIRFGPEVLVEYAANYILGYQKELLLEWSKEGATVESIEQEYLAQHLFFVPPKAEQGEICEFLQNKKKYFDALNAQAQSAITLLKERRTALISAAVTGKIDVRDWQPPQPLSDTDLSTETLQEAAL